MSLMASKQLNLEMVNAGMSTKKTVVDFMYSFSILQKHVLHFASAR